MTQLINLVTGHIIGHRMNWGLYIKKTLELHPICRNGVEGANKAKELAVHVSLEASNIIQHMVVRMGVIAVSVARLTPFCLAGRPY